MKDATELNFTLELNIHTISTESLHCDETGANLELALKYIWDQESKIVVDYLGQTWELPSVLVSDKICWFS